MQFNKKEISFIHTADLHLASPFSGLSKENRQLADFLHRSVFSSFDAIIDLCLEKSVDLLLIAGDIFDSREKNLMAMHHFIRALERLREQNIQVIIATGNHDPLRPEKGESSIWDDILHITGDEPPFYLVQSDSCNQVDIRHNNETVARVCGRSFLKAETYENPVSRFPKKNDPSIPWIGLVHCTIGSSSGHIPYAPVSITDLTSLGYDYWALGHIHAGFTVHEKDPVIIYPGNIQGRNWRETGARGCIYGIIHTDGTIDTKFFETAPVTFETMEVSIQGMEEESELLSAIENIFRDISPGNNKTSTILSITITGSGKLHQNLIQTNMINEIFKTYQEYNPYPPFCFLSAINDKTTASIDREAIKGKGDIFDEICRIADSLAEEPGLAKARSILAPLFHHHSLKHVLEKLSEDEIKLLIQKAEDNIFLGLGAADED